MTAEKKELQKIRERIYKIKYRRKNKEAVNLYARKYAKAKREKKMSDEDYKNYFKN
jgi:hypothetical protein